MSKKKSRRKQVVLDTPKVIALPDGTAQQATEVMENTSIPSGETSPVDLGTSNDLVQAASKPADALRETIIDAEYEDRTPPTEAELTTEELLKQTDELIAAEQPVRDHPAIRDMFDDHRTAPEADFSEWSFNVISEGGQKLLNWLRKQQLRAIAIGNDVLDWYNKTGLKLAEWWGKTTLSINEWSLKKIAEYREWQATVSPKRDSSENGAALAAVLDAFGEKFDSLKEAYEKEMRRMDKRITGLEKELRQATKRIEKSDQVDPDKLNELLKAMTSGRKTNAVHLYHNLTGLSLADSKAALQELATA